VPLLQLPTPVTHSGEHSGPSTRIFQFQKNEQHRNDDFDRAFCQISLLQTHWTLAESPESCRNRGSTDKTSISTMLKTFSNFSNVAQNMKVQRILPILCP